MNYLTTNRFWFKEAVCSIGFQSPRPVQGFRSPALRWVGCFMDGRDWKYCTTLVQDSDSCRKLPFLGSQHDNCNLRRRNFPSLCMQIYKFALAQLLAVSMHADILMDLFAIWCILGRWMVAYAVILVEGITMDFIIVVKDMSQLSTLTCPNSQLCWG